MNKLISVITRDDFLFQKIYLILKPCADIIRERGGEDICFWDIDSMGLPADEENTVKISRMGGDLIRPFGEEELFAILNSDKTPTVALKLGERCVHLRGRRIKLTELEFSLLSRLVFADGDFVTRDELISSVFGDGVEGGILNVYIHYLREKLECEGEKIILSSRCRGYKIDEKYLGKGEV